MSLQQKKARAPVYEFAHRWLPGMAFTDPKTLKQVLDTNSKGWLDDVWFRVNARLAKEGHPPMRWEAQAAVKLTTPSGDFYFVHPPAPEGFAECIWVAFFYAGAERTLSYFTLELGFNGDGQPYDLLCGWTSDNKHLNSSMTLGSREVEWGAQSILEWLARPAPDRK